MKVKNWGGNLSFTPSEIKYPNSEKEIIEVIQKANSENKQIRIKGSGHSWTKLIPTNSILVSLDNYQGIISIDKTESLVTVKAGTKLKLLGQLLANNGLAMENLGDIDVQSIAGALNTGTHGTGIAFGTLSTQIAALTLISGEGKNIVCSETENPDIFKAAQISLGALGIISSYTLKCVPAYILKYECKKEILDECLQKLETYNTNNRHFEFYWFPHTSTVQTKFMNISKEIKKGNQLLKKFNDVVVDNGVFWLLSEFTRLFPMISKYTSHISAWGVSTGSYSDKSNNIFATTRLVKFTEMEFNIPRENFISVIKEIQKVINKNKVKVHFPLECRFVKEDDIMISPANGRASAYIAAHMYKGMPYKPYFKLLEDIFKKYDGRPHYGKLNTFSHQDFEKVYPNWGKFKKVRNQLDPKGIFLNDYLKGIFDFH